MTNTEDADESAVACAGPEALRALSPQQSEMPFALVQGVADHASLPR
jgi:hypothetical protein